MFLIRAYDRHRTIADRLIGLRLVPSRLIVRRNVSYEFMNRQMVWHAFTVRNLCVKLDIAKRVDKCRLFLGIPYLPYSIDQCAESETAVCAVLCQSHQPLNLVAGLSSCTVEACGGVAGIADGRRSTSRRNSA